MKKLLNVVLWLFVIIIVIEIIVFVGNFIRNMVIINKIYSAKDKAELLENYEIDYEIRVINAYVNDDNIAQNEKKTYKYIVKDNNTRINEYSYNGAAFEQYKVKSSTLKYGDVKDAKQVLNMTVMNESILSKKMLLKEYLFKPIKVVDDMYVISRICLSQKDGVGSFIDLKFDKENGFIIYKEIYEMELDSSKLRVIENAVTESFRVKCDVVTDDFLYEVDEKFEAF